MSLDALLVLQAQDSACDRLRHRRANLPERTTLTDAQRDLVTITPQLEDAIARRDEVAREVKRLEDETTVLATRAADVERTMYSGTVTSPRELQALQADIEQLARHRGALEDRELDLMEKQESLDAEVAGFEAMAQQARRVAEDARQVIAVREAEIDAEIATESAARDVAAAELPAPLLAAYDRGRAQAPNGVAVARLVGNTCQACMLTIPATEVDRIRREGAGPPVPQCDNCGAILVPT